MRNAGTDEWDNRDMDEILGIVERLALEAADGDTSIPGSKLARIIDAVGYCIEKGEDATAFEESSNLPANRRRRPSELYESGFGAIIAMARRALSEYNEVSAFFDDYGMEEYGMTFRREIPAALSSFDPRFNPAEELIFSYPLPDENGAVGAEAILEAVRRIRFEQETLCKLDRRLVRGRARRASASHENLHDAVVEALRADTREQADAPEGPLFGRS